jgi:hypothetical protein
MILEICTCHMKPSIPNLFSRHLQIKILHFLATLLLQSLWCTESMHHRSIASMYKHVPLLIFYSAPHTIPSIILYYPIYNSNVGLSGVRTFVECGHGRVGRLRPPRSSATLLGGRLWQTATPTAGRSLRPTVGMRTAAPLNGRDGGRPVVR